MFSGTYPVKNLHGVRPGWAQWVLVLWVQTGLLYSETRFHHLQLNSLAPEAAHQFFTERFGARPGQALGAKLGVDTGRGWIVAQPAAEVKEGKTALWHIGFGFLDMRADYIRHLDMGTPFSQPLELLVPGAYFAYVNGPGGLQIEVNTSKQEGFGHLHLWSAHPLVAGDWYQRLLGLKLIRPLEDKPVQVGRYTFGASAYLKAGDVSVLISPKPDDVPELAPSEGTLVECLGFQVDNLDAMLLALRRSGTRILTPAGDVAPGVRSAMVLGPDRIKIRLVEAK